MRPLTWVSLLAQTLRSPTTGLILGQEDNPLERNGNFPANCLRKISMDMARLQEIQKKPKARGLTLFLMQVVRFSGNENQYEIKRTVGLTQNKVYRNRGVKMK